MKQIKFENVGIVFPNFSGKERIFNISGNRNFAITIDDEDVARGLREVGFNIKQLAPIDGEERKVYFLYVKIIYNEFRHPEVKLFYEDREPEDLNEETIGFLDLADITKATVTIVPYEYEINGEKKYAAYLDSMDVVVKDDFKKYCCEMYTEIERRDSMKDPYLSDLVLDKKTSFVAVDAQLNAVSSILWDIAIDIDDDVLYEDHLDEDYLSDLSDMIHDALEQINKIRFKLREEKTDETN